jgi:hypothetical protein
LNEVVDSEANTAGPLTKCQSEEKRAGLYLFVCEKKNLSASSCKDVRLEICNVLSLELAADPGLESTEDRYFLEMAITVLERLILSELGVWGGIPGSVS